MRLDERNNKLVGCFILVGRIPSYSGYYNKTLVWDLYLLGPCNSIISRTCWGDQICQLLECAPRWVEQSINRLFHSSMPGSRVIVANITKHRFEIYTFWDLVTQLSRELVGVDQICQLLECAPRWEEQSINRVFDSSLPGSRVIVANIPKHRFEIYSFWDLVTQLSRELVEVDQICQLVECAPRWEEQ